MCGYSPKSRFAGIEYSVVLVCYLTVYNSYKAGLCFFTFNYHLLYDRVIVETRGYKTNNTIDIINLNKHKPMITVYSDRIEILSRGTLAPLQTLSGFLRRLFCTCK